MFAIHYSSVETAAAVVGEAAVAGVRSALRRDAIAEASRAWHAVSADAEASTVATGTKARTRAGCARQRGPLPSNLAYVRTRVDAVHANRHAGVGRAESGHAAIHAGGRAGRRIA